MRTLPTVTLEMGDANGSIVWKAFYPYADQAIKAKLEQFGLSYESSLRLSVLPYSTELPETIRTSLVNMAYVVVKGANHATSPFEKTPVQSLAPAKPSVTAGALLHHGEHRIKVAMTYDESCVKQLRSIEDARWSRTHRCWHLPRTKEAWAALNKLFTVTVEANAATETEKKGPDQPPTAPSQGGQQAPQPEYPTSKITIVPHSKRTDIIGLRLPKEMAPDHLATVKNIHGRRWNPEALLWELPNTRLTMRFLDKYLKEHLHWRLM